MNQVMVEKALDACLLTDEEMKGKPSDWKESFLDTFPTFVDNAETDEDSDREDGEVSSDEESMIPE